MKVLVINGSVRPGSNGEKVAAWIKSVAAKNEATEIDLVDASMLDLPLYNEPAGGPTALAYMGKEYENPKGRAWANRVAAADAVIVMTPEYNRSFSAAVKNMLDWVGPEWKGKPAAVVTYGYAGHAGVRAFAALLPVLQELGLYVANASLHIENIFEAFDENGAAKNERNTDTLQAMLTELSSLATKLSK